jgi:hypothetical protein
VNVLTPDICINISTKVCGTSDKKNTADIKSIKPVDLLNTNVNEIDYVKLKQKWYFRPTKKYDSKFLGNFYGMKTLTSLG